MGIEIYFSRQAALQAGFKLLRTWDNGTSCYSTSANPGEKEILLVPHFLDRTGLQLVPDKLYYQVENLEGHVHWDVDSMQPGPQQIVVRPPGRSTFLQELLEELDIRFMQRELP